MPLESIRSINYGAVLQIFYRELIGLRQGRKKDALFLGYGPVDDDIDETIEKIKDRVTKCQGKVSYFTDHTDHGSEIMARIVPPKVIPKYEPALRYTFDTWQKKDETKHVVNNDGELTVIVLHPGYINTYFQAQYDQDVSLSAGEAIFCENYFKEGWAGEFTRI